MKKLIFAHCLLLLTSGAFAACNFHKRTLKVEFNGELSPGTMIEKKSLEKVDAAFPTLKLKEKVYSGEVSLCSECVGAYVTCE